MTDISELEHYVLEQLFGHRSIEILWQVNSRSSHIFGVHEARGPWVVKMPGWKNLLVVNPQDRKANVDLMNRTATAFLKRLTELGVQLPHFYEIKEIHGFPVHLSSDHGADCARIIRHSPSELLRTLQKIVRTLRVLLNHGNKHIGIDAQLSNFALSKDGSDVVYIDIFPPLIKFEDCHFVHFPNPTTDEEIRIEIERKFTPFGILRRLRLDLSFANPTWITFFTQALDELDDPTLRNELKDRFDMLADQRVSKMSTTERRRLLYSLPPGDADSRREIAAQLIPVDAVRQSTMQQVFASTSFLGISELERRSHTLRLEQFHQIIEPLL